MSHERYLLPEEPELMHLVREHLTETALDVLPSDRGWPKKRLNFSGLPVF